MFYWIEERTDIYIYTPFEDKQNKQYRIYKNIFYHHRAGLNFVAILLKNNVQEIWHGRFDVVS